MSSAAVAEPGTAFRCGHVAVIGRPNVGKSTLVNQLVGQKLCITSRRPQTTRWAVLGIQSTDRAQIIYVDTPGIQPEARQALGRHMNREIGNALAGVDLVLLVLEALKWGPADEAALQTAGAGSVPVVLVLNKLDRVRDKNRLLPFIAELAKLPGVSDIIPVSAQSGAGIPELEALVQKHLPEGPAAYPEDMFTDRNERFLAAEFVREKLMRKLGAEVPYQLAVSVEKFEVKKNITHIHAVIWVETDGQKAIVIGAGGKMLKAVGQEARVDLEKMMGHQVNLKTWVKVKKDWSEDAKALRLLGYEQ